MSFLIPWTLLEWARDNRVLRVRWFGLEAEFAVPSSPPATLRRAAGGDEAPPAELGLGAGLPPEEQERLRRERDKAEAEKALYHSA